MSRRLEIAVWSVIAGAFVGPGTITTAASAGAGFGLTLVWALVFSTAACVVLQEASARVTIVTGAELGELLGRRVGGGFGGAALTALVLGAIVVGCAAFEAGNILGAVAGVAHVFELPRRLLTLAIGLLAGLLLWFGSARRMAIVFSALVGLMGLAFVVTAIGLAPAPLLLLRGALVPALPEGSSLLVIGLVGTTVVPYNLFLGSRLARGRSLHGMRFGMPLAVAAGGAISVAILITGTAVDGTFSFAALANVLAARLGPWASVLFGLGLFAAGFTSAVSAPWAAAVTARSMLGHGRAGWEEGGRGERIVWLGVLATGVGCGLLDLRPIPVILLAQALNGVLLPVAAVALLVVANDRRLLADAIGSPARAVAQAVAVLVSIGLGVTGVARAAAAAVGAAPPSAAMMVGVAVTVAAVAAAPVAHAVVRARRG